MSTTRTAGPLVIVVSGGHGMTASPHLLAAADRGGALPVVDVASGDSGALRAVQQCARRAGGPFGVRVGAGCTATLADVEAVAGTRLDTIVLGPDAPWALPGLNEKYRVIAEVTDLGQARAAAAAGADGLIARGMESGGRVSELSSFVLLQQLAADTAAAGLPIWVAGGIGPHTAAASLMGGAAGVVLDSQLALMPESVLTDELSAVLRRMDGSEPVLLDGTRGLLLGAGDDRADSAALVPIGADGWLAASFSKRWCDTTAAVRGISQAIAETFGAPDGESPQDAGWLPIAQGPMTRVSDEAGFAAAVAAEGALPFIALALANADQSRRMLTEAAQALGERPWGVGVLGFAPDQLRAAQLEVIREVKPPFAIIAGGRPAQAKGLEHDGISSFLHVPSPGLLQQFLQAGSRKFIFEGAECGGHVGPRASFPLWEAQLQVLEAFLDAQPTAAAGGLQVYFAGGIHDARSAAMVAAMVRPLTRRGMRAGLLMGTAYLFTAEAVTHGAIQPLFQQAAVAATRTALLETAPGHATRCLPSPFVDDFHALRERLEAEGVENRLVWEELEQLNIGRLRLASKGLRREGAELIAVDRETQAGAGLFMAGQVAVLRDRVTTVAELHHEVTLNAARFGTERAVAVRAELGLDEPPAVAAQPPLDIAIVGMACVFPGSPDLDGFWQTVIGGADAVTEVPADRWDVSTYYSPEVGKAQTGRFSVSKWGGFIDPVPFDALGYGIPPSALAGIDPTQLIALEIAHRALLDAGYAGGPPGPTGPTSTGAARRYDHSRTGVVFGAEEGSDMSRALNVRMATPAYFGDVPQALDDALPQVSEDTFPGVLANVIAGRIANRLDLGGPNFTVDAACASSLAALDIACKHLAAGTSDLMLCGGADLHNGITDYLMFTSAQALSPTGKCRSFDSAGDGIALGEGVACLVLKRLGDAERDGDRVYAVVKGLGGSSDGRALGLTAPRAEGQRRALDRAYAEAGISPREVGLIEAHGTGTVVGDRTELETLTRLFADSGARPGGTVIGSVKSQIGHTKCAAGMAGLIKTALALYTGIKPPTLHLSRPNPAWNPADSPFAFHTQARPWAVPAAGRVAGVSAFGFGGTNFHAVLGAHPPTADPQHAQHEWPAELFLFRGSDLAAARRAVQALLDVVTGAHSTGPAHSIGPAHSTGPALRLRDLAATAAATARGNGTGLEPARIAVVATDPVDLVGLLNEALTGGHDPKRGLIQPPEAPAAGPGKVAFLFPGQGSQRAGALAELFVAFPELRGYLDLGKEWVDLLFPPSAFDEEAEQAQQDRVRDTRVAQPVLGIGGLAVDHLLRRFGVRPDLAGGHSYGELVALCTTGAFDPATLLELSRERAAAILDAAGDDPGTMAAVNASAEQVSAALAAAGLGGVGEAGVGQAGASQSCDVVLANHNAPSQVVISGPTEAVGRAVAALRSAGLQARALPVAAAFHSPVVAAGAQTFAAVLAGREVRAPSVPVWSNASAAPYPATAEAVRAGLAQQIGAPVRFVEQIEGMYADGGRVFIEAGPGRVLSGLVRAVLGDRPHLMITCDGRPGQGLRALLTAAGELACAGVPVQTGWLYRGRGRAAAESSGASAPQRPMWSVNGQLVRDQQGNCLRGGMTPPRRIEDLPMSNSGRDVTGDLLSDFLRTSREMIAAQRDVMLAYLGERNGVGDAPAQRGRMVWQPAEPSELTEPATVVDLRAGETVLSAAPARPVVTGLLAAEPVLVPVPAAPALDVQAAVLGVISERTGYPIDLIELDLDLEADLSVDSIKRAEVAGEVANRLHLLVDGDAAELEELVKARTVRAMVSWLDAHIAAGATANSAVPVVPVVPLVPAVPQVPAEPPTELPAAGIAPQRLISQVEAAPAVTRGGTPLTGARFVITGDGQTGSDLAELLGQVGATVHTGPDLDLTSPDGVILLDGLLSDGEPLLPQLYGVIRQALAAGPRWLIAAGREGGRARTDGMPGLFRTVAREYPEVVVRYLEFGPPTAGDTGDTEGIARAILEELGEAPGAAVVTRSRDGRQIGHLLPVGLGALAAGGAGPAGDGVAEAQALGLTPESVVVLIGGARGITPWFARTMAMGARCRIVLAGRTPLPQTDEDPQLATATDQPSLRAAFAARGMRAPAEIDRATRAVLAAREVALTLAELSDLGAEVTYRTLDVRDDDAVQRLIKGVHDQYGRIDALVYAAGIIDDKLVADKDPASFARVYDTKVEGARSVLDALTRSGAAPGFVVLFGSIAAVYGNRGQSDYAAANDALQSICARWALQTGHRALTVHWGPWAPTGRHGGMVSQELTADYARRGIKLIDPEEGALSLLRELAWGDPAVRSVVYTASGW